MRKGSLTALYWKTNFIIVRKPLLANVVEVESLALWGFTIQWVMSPAITGKKKKAKRYSRQRKLLMAIDRSLHLQYSRPNC